MSPLLSIIIPVYNAEEFLKRCIDSVLLQSFSDFELILVNDGSIDSSLAICQEYAEHDARIVILDRKNSGPGISRIEGVKTAKGKWVTFVDSDDALSSETIADIMGVLRANNNIDVVQYPIILVNEDGDAIETRQMYAPEMVSSMKAVLTKWCCPGEKISGFLCGKFYRREILLPLDLPEGMRTSEDSYMMGQILQRCKNFCFSDKGRYLYYLRNGSLSNFGNKETDTQMLNSMEVLIQKLNIAKEQQLYVETKVKAFAFAMTSLSNFIINCNFTKSIAEKYIGQLNSYPLSMCSIVLSKVSAKIKLKTAMARMLGAGKMIAILNAFYVICKKRKSII